jgi:uncharacterized membrane protein YbaN (DUF454 family)
MTLATIEQSEAKQPFEELRVVHSLRGRVRVHLPHWPDTEGELAAWVGWLHGVTSASASALTGHVLIHFDPNQTSQNALLTELAAYCADAAARVPALRIAEETVTELAFPGVPVAPAAVAGDSSGLQGTYVTGVRRKIYLALGWASVGMAVVGILPGIPTVPFLVLAAYFFVRSSPEAHAWLRSSRWFGKILRDWEEQHAVSVEAKYAAVALILVAMVITLLIGLPLWLLLTIYGFEIVGLAIVLRLPVVQRSSAPDMTNA